MVEPRSRWRGDDGMEDMLELAKSELAVLHAEHTELIRQRNQLVRALRDSNGYLIGGPQDRVRDLGDRIKQRMREPWRAFKGNRARAPRLAAALAKAVTAETVARPIIMRRRLKALDTTTTPSRFSGDRPILSSIKEGDYRRGRLWVAALEAVASTDVPFLRAARKLAASDGSISENVRFASKLLRHDPRFRDHDYRVLEGRLMELTGWTPRLPGPVERIQPRSAETVLHLVKESRPYHSNGFTSRSHANFTSERDAGLDPVVVTEPGFPRDLVGDDFPRTESIDGIEHHRLDLGPSHADLPVSEWLQDFAWLAAEKVRQIRPAVLHVSSGRRGYETALVGLALQEKFDLPLVYEVRSFFEATWTSEAGVDVESETFERRYAVETMCMERADRVLTLGTAMKDELITRGIPAEKIDIVPNGVDIDRFVPAGVPADLEAEYSITMPTFGYVSNMDHRREGQELLIRAAAQIKAAGGRAQCILVGGGARVEELKALARDLDVQERVVFTGPIDHSDIAGHYALIDVFVVPRIHERAANYVTPLKPFEAMAMERPVVVSSLPALLEVVDPPERGKAFEAENVTALVEAVTGLLDDPEERRRLALAGRRWVEDNRQWKHNGPRYSAAYEAAKTAHAEGAADNR